MEIATLFPYAPFKQLQQTDPQGYKVKKRETYQAIMTSVRDLIPDVDRYTRLRVYGTPTTSERFLGQPEGNIMEPSSSPSK